jgi:hypothetical protein
MLIVSSSVYWIRLDCVAARSIDVPCIRSATALVTVANIGA